MDHNKQFLNNGGLLNPKIVGERTFLFLQNDIIFGIYFEVYIYIYIGSEFVHRG